LKEYVSFRIQFLYGTPLLNLHSYILCISTFIILTNVDTLITLYFYFCRWNFKKRKKIEEINKTFSKITQFTEVAWTMATFLVKSDDQYIWIWMQYVVFFEIIVYENHTFFFNVMDIESQLKDKGLLISVPFCMTKILLFIYNKIYFVLFVCVVQYSFEMLYRWINVLMHKYYNDEMWTMMI